MPPPPPPPPPPPFSLFIYDDGCAEVYRLLERLTSWLTRILGTPMCCWLPIDSWNWKYHPDYTVHTSTHRGRARTHTTHIPPTHPLGGQPMNMTSQAGRRQQQQQRAPSMIHAPRRYTHTDTHRVTHPDLGRRRKRIVVSCNEKEEWKGAGALRRLRALSCLPPLAG